MNTLKYKDRLLQLCLGVCLGGMVALEGYAETAVTQDPTKPPAEVLAGTLGDAQSEAIVLNGIKQDGKASIAILNDTFVRVGDRYKGYRLIAVHAGQAILEDESKQKLTLTMDVVDFKKATTAASSPVKKKRQSKDSSTRNINSTNKS